MTGTLERAPTGETRLAYKAHDDHGIAGARAEITLDLAKGRPALRAGGRRPSRSRRWSPTCHCRCRARASEISETLVEDFSKHPFAGLPVTVRLVAEDATGQTGSSEPVSAVLPMRRFYDPMALALVEQRRDLMWSTANGRRVTQVLRAVTYHPDGQPSTARAPISWCATAIRRLARAVAGRRRGRGAAARSPRRCGRRRSRSRTAISATPRAAGQGPANGWSRRCSNGASDEEIARLMDELRQATRDYMNQMAQDAIKRGDQQQAQIPPGQTDDPGPDPAADGPDPGADASRVARPRPRRC